MPVLLLSTPSSTPSSAPSTGDRMSNDSDPRRAPPAKPQGPSSDRRLMLLSTTLAGSVLAGVGFGYFLDRYLGTTPRWTAILGFLFLASGMYQLIKEASR